MAPRNYKPRKPTTNGSKPKKTIAKKTTNKKQTNINTKAISKIISNSYGNRQYQTSVMYPTLPLHVTAGSPLLFHVDNPNTGNHGPYVWHVNSLGNVQHTNNRFNVWNDPAGSTAGFHDDEDLRVCNGPIAKLNYVDLQFEFCGFVDSTHIQIHIIRQKRMDTDFWNQNQADKFLPNTLTGLKNIAGFNPNRISYKDFQVLATRKIYMNSKGQANALDTAQDRNTTDATTSSIKYAHINLKLNKVIKQLNSSVNENIDMVADPLIPHTDRPYSSAYQYDNKHPLSNIWCLISCDDQTALDSIVTGDAVCVKVIRRCGWQDRIGHSN